MHTQNQPSSYQESHSKSLTFRIEIYRNASADKLLFLFINVHFLLLILLLNRTKFVWYLLCQWKPTTLNLESFFVFHGWRNSMEDAIMLSWRLTMNLTNFVWSKFEKLCKVYMWNHFLLLVGTTFGNCLLLSFLIQIIYSVNVDRMH